MAALDSETPGAYRKRAEELRVFAEKFEHAQSKAQLFSIADHWDAMAKRAENYGSSVHQSREIVERSRQLLDRINKKGL